MKKEDKKIIELGDTVKDIYTGFTGIATSKTEFINGCIQYGVAPKWNKGDKVPMEEVGINSESLIVIKKGPRIKVKEVKKEINGDYNNNGGPTRKAPVQRGF